MCKKCKSSICNTPLTSKAWENQCLEFRGKGLKGLNVELIQWHRDMANGSAEALNKAVLLFLYKCKITVDFSPTALDSHKWNRWDSRLPVCKAVQCLFTCPGYFHMCTNYQCLVIIYLLNSITCFCTFLILTLQIQMLWRKGICLLSF